MAVHLRHFNVSHYKIDMLIDGITARLGFLKIIPRLLAVVGFNGVDITGAVQAFNNHLGKQHGILGNQDFFVGAFTIAELVEILELDAGFRTNFSDNFFKIKNRYEAVLIFGDTGSDPLGAAVDNFIGLLDFAPGNSVDSNNAMYMKSKVKGVKICNDKNIMIVGRRIDDRYRLTAETENVLRITKEII